MNIVLEALILLISFFLCAGSPDFLSGVLNSVALLFIPMLDDELVAHVANEPPRELVLYRKQQAQVRSFKEELLHAIADPGAAKLGAPVPDEFEDLAIGYAGSIFPHQQTPCPFVAPFAERRITDVHISQEMNFVEEDPFDSQSTYLFSKVRYQLQRLKREGNGNDKGNEFERVSYLELVPLDEACKTIVTGEKDTPREKPDGRTAPLAVGEIEEISGVIAIVSYACVGQLYGMRMLRFGSIQDVRKFFAFFHQAVKFKLPAEPGQERAGAADAFFRTRTRDAYRPLISADEDAPEVSRCGCP
jgi:hypothetical protein